MLSGFVYARMRLETGSIWPAIVLHGAWNSIFQTAFVPATTGAGAVWWVGESGILTLIALVVAAIIFSRGHWTIRRDPKCHKALLQQALYPEFPRMRYTGSPVAGNFPSRQPSK